MFYMAASLSFTAVSYTHLDVYKRQVRLRYDAARGYGRIEISFSSLEECDGILSTIGINKADK